jgi:hypothetical protein
MHYDIGVTERPDHPPDSLREGQIATVIQLPADFSNTMIKISMSIFRNITNQASQTTESQICKTACNSGGPQRWLKIPLDVSKPPITFIEQAVSALARMLQSGNDAEPYVPFFGKPGALVINYSPHCCWAICSSLAVTAFSTTSVGSSRALGKRARARLLLALARCPSHNARIRPAALAGFL